MPKKATNTGTGITEEYLLARCDFENHIVIKAVKKDKLWEEIVSKFDPEDQHAIFKVSETTLEPLNEAEIDGLFVYLPNEVRSSIDFISLSKEEKLDLILENKESLSEVIEKRGYSDRIGLKKKQITPIEKVSSSKLWDIIKTGKYNLS